MEYVDYENLTEGEVAGMEEVTVLSKVSELPMSGNKNISPYALGMSVRIDLEKRRRSTQTEEEKNMMLGNTSVEVRGKLSGGDKVVEAANILRKLDSNCGSVVYREALATRMQLRKLALKNFSAQSYSDALMQAHYSLLLAKKFHMEVSKTPLSGEMAMELLILSKCYAQVGRHDVGRTHLMELKFLVEQTLIHLSNSKEGNNEDKALSTAPHAIINCDAKVFPSIVYTLGEIMTMYDMIAEAELFFSKYLVLFEREFGEDSVQLSDAINSVCIYLLRSGQYMKALPLSVKALNIQKKHFGDYTSETPDNRVAEGYCNVGIIYRMAGNPIDALHNFLIAIDMKMRILQDRSHPQVQDILLSIGCCQHMLKNFHAAASIYREVYITRCETLGTTHPITIAVKQLLEDLDNDIQIEPKEGDTKDEQKEDGTALCGAPDAVKALAEEMGHDKKGNNKGTPGIEMSRIQALYTNKTKHFIMQDACIMRTQECLLPHKQVLEISKQITIQYNCKRLPIINVPRMARGRLYIKEGQPVMECNQDAADLLLEWDLRPPEVTFDGDVVGSDPKLPLEVQLFIPIMEGKDPVKGFYDKPLFVPNPGIFHAFKRFKAACDFNVVQPTRALDRAASVRRLASTRGNQLTPREIRTPSTDNALAAKVAPVTTKPKLPVKVPGGKAPMGIMVKEAPATNTPAVLPDTSNMAGENAKINVGGSTESTTGGNIPTQSKIQGTEAPDHYSGGAAPKIDAASKDANEPKQEVVKEVETPPKAPEPKGVPLVELLMKKSNSGANARNAKFLAKIGNLAKIVVKPQFAPGLGGTNMLPKVKVAVPVAKASPPSSEAESMVGTDVSDIEDEQVVLPQFEVFHAPKAFATMVDAPPKDALPLDLRSITDPMPMDMLSMVRGIRSHKEDGKPTRCMLLDEKGDPIAVVPWQIDMMSLTLAKSCLSLDLIGQLCSAEDVKDGASEKSKAEHLEEYRKLLAGEGLHNLGFASLISGMASQALSAGGGSLGSGLGMDIPPSVLANLKKQAEELEKKGKEEDKVEAKSKAEAPPAVKVVPIMKKGAPAAKKGAPKGLAPPPMKKGALPTKNKTKGTGLVIDNAKVRRFFWDPIFGEDAKGTLFSCPKGMATLEKPEIEETFAKAAPKAKVAVATKPKAVNLLPDAKRAYNMNISLSKFAKYTFKELKDAVMGLDPTILNVEATESLMMLAPTVEEANIVNEYIKSGGDIHLADRPEQFVAVISGIPMLKQRLESHHVALTFKEHFQEIIEPLEKIMDSCESVMSSVKLNILSNIILKIGNTLNEGDPKKGNAEGFKPTTFAKLNEFRTTTKPTKTLMQYICDIAAKDDETVLEIYNELRVCEDCSKIDITVLDGNIAKFKNDIQKVKNVIAGAEKLNDPLDEFVPIMKDFLKDAEPKVMFVQEQHKEAMMLFRETVKYMGYPDKEVDKVKVDELFRHIWGFAKSVEMARKVRIEAFEKEQRRILAENRKIQQTNARKAKMRTSLISSNITATPKMVDDLQNTIKMY